MQINQHDPALNKPEEASKPKKHFTESKKNYEILFKIMFVGASVFSAYLLNKIYLFQTMPEFIDIRIGNIYDMLFYSLPFSIIFTIFDIVYHKIFDGLCIKYYLNETKYQGKSREKRAYTIVKWSYSIIYYSISSVVGYMLIKDTSFFPTWLGGNGACMNLVQHAPKLPEATFGMKIFYLLQFGKHFSRLFSHVFIKQEGNFYEYILHHSLSSFLIFFSYLTNQWLIGIMVLLCHDVSDLFLILARGYKDYKRYSKFLLQIFYVFAMGSWILGRLVVFPACCVYSSLIAPTFVHQKLTPVQAEILDMPYRWMGYMLVGLLVLQGFWTYYIAQAFVEVNVSQKMATNTYQAVTQ